MKKLTFAEVTEVNRRRCAKWHPGFPHEDLNNPLAWNGADWSNAMQGEAGEAGNVVKKLRRKQVGLRGAVDPSVSALVDKLAEEIADTFIYLDLLATYYNIDIAQAIIKKFNATSEREGFEERLTPR